MTPEEADKFHRTYPFLRGTQIVAIDRAQMEHWADRKITTGTLAHRLAVNNRWPSDPPSADLIDYLATLGYRRRSIN